MSSTTKVLVVDDDDDIREFVSLALSDEGYDVALAPNGKVALQEIERARPDVILLDARMPIMDGPAFLSAYRTRTGSRVPIIMMTADHREAREGGYAGVDAYLSKPFSLLELLELIEQKVRRDENRALSVQ